MQQQQFSVSWMRLLMSSYQLDLQLAIVHWKATVWKKFYLLLKSYKILFYSKWMWSSVCTIRNMTASKLTEESAIKGHLSHYSICPSQLKHQMKFGFWIKASVLYEQLLSSVPSMQHFVPYTTVCLWSLYTEQSINYFGQKLTFFFKFSKFQHGLLKIYGLVCCIISKKIEGLQFFS